MVRYMLWHQAEHVTQLSIQLVHTVLGESSATHIALLALLVLICCLFDQHLLILTTIYVRFLCLLLCFYGLLRVCSGISHFNCISTLLHARLRICVLLLLLAYLLFLSLVLYFLLHLTNDHFFGLFVLVNGLFFPIDCLLLLLSLDPAC